MIPTKAPPENAEEVAIAANENNAIAISAPPRAKLKRQRWLTFKVNLLE